MVDDQSSMNQFRIDSAGSNQFDASVPKVERKTVARAMKSLFRKWTKLFSLSLVTLTIASLFAASSTLCELICQFRVQYIALLVVSILFLIILKEKSFLVVAAVALVFNVSQLWSFFSPEARVSSANFRVMTINVNAKNAAYQHVASVLESSNADVISVQELHPQMGDYLASHLKSYPHQYARPRLDNFGTGVYSKFPLKGPLLIPVPKRLLPEESFGEPAPEVDVVKIVVTVNGKDITLLDVHPVPPMADDSLAWRNDGFAKIAEIAASTDGNVIVAGDLNCTLFSPYFEKLLKDGKLKDSERGFGIQPTWPVQLPVLFIPIDHILYRGDLTPVSRENGPATGSDHRPVLVSFWFGQKPVSN